MSTIILTAITVTLMSTSTKAAVAEIRHPAKRVGSLILKQNPPLLSRKNLTNNPLRKILSTNHTQF